MSYDLYFYKKKESQLSEEKVAEYFTKNIKNNISDHPKQWVYENPETGVYFLIEWNEPEEDVESLKVFDDFKDFKYLNFNSSINFFRPRYFAYEIFPIIEKFINELDLYILNSQDEIDPNNPRKFEIGYFKEQWIRHNDSLALEQFNKLHFEYFPPDKSDYMWLFQSQRDFLQNSLTEDIFVPGYLLFKDNTNQLYTACVWPEHIPIILPPVDFLILKIKHKKLFKTIEKSGLVSYDTIINQFKDQFEDFQSEIPNLKVLNQENADGIAKEFNALVFEKKLDEITKTIRLDGFVNVKP